MSVEKINFDGTRYQLAVRNFYATCPTPAATAAKVITTVNDGFELSPGTFIVIKFSATNTANNPTFNVNGTGAKKVWYNTGLITTTSSTRPYAGTANRPMVFVYDGEQYVFVGWSTDANTTYTNVSLGQGYGTCETGAGIISLTVTLASYALTVGGIVVVKFTNDVPPGATMAINSKAAKPVYYQGAAITAGVIKAGDEATFIYDGTNYRLLSIDRLAGDLTSLSNQIAQKAPLASPALTGNPTAPTQAAGNSSTRIATTAFVQNAVTSAKVIIVDVAASKNTSTTVTNAAITADHVPLNDVVSGAGADVGVTTAAGSVTIECTAGIPAFRLILGLPQ